MKLKTKDFIKIPKTVKMVYCNEKNILKIDGPLGSKAMKLSVKPFFFTKNSDVFVLVTFFPINYGSNHQYKSLKAVRGALIAAIKKNLIEVSCLLYIKLKLVGVGYRGFQLEEYKGNIHFKLGHSHLIYFKMPLNTVIYAKKYTTIFLFGSASFFELTQLAGKIRDCRRPDCYKGKGVLHYQEQVQLKKGKRV